MTAPGCHVERVGGVPVLVNGELTAADRAEVEDFAALLRELGKSQSAPCGELSAEDLSRYDFTTLLPELGPVQTAPEPRDVLRLTMARRAVRRLGEPCDQCTGHDRQHTDDCPEGAL